MPLFQCAEPSDAILNALDAKHTSGGAKKHIKPEMTTKGGLFRMFTTDVSPEEMAAQREALAEGTKQPDALEIVRGRPKPPDKSNSSFAERYYWALLEADRAREELKATQVQEAEDEDLGVKPLKGKFEIELEVTVNRAPDVSDSEEEEEEEKEEEKSEENEEGSEASSKFDAAAELQALQTELAAMDAQDDEIRRKAEDKEAARRARVDDAKRRREEERRLLEEAAREKAKLLKKQSKAKAPVPSFEDIPNAGANLALGGTMYFAPDAERLALAPSLPPPPPPSQFGRHQMKMKPRLPLDISWNRYRDEQVSYAMPGGVSEDEVNRRVQEKIRTVDFWAASRVAAMRVQKEKDDRLRRQLKSGDRTRAPNKHWEDRVGKHVTNELKNSRAWMTWRSEDAEKKDSPQSTDRRN